MAIRRFDESILQETLATFPSKELLILSQDSCVATALTSMKTQHCGSVVITRDGTANTNVIGIFTERDVLNRVIDRYGDLSQLPLSDVMTENPIVLTVHDTIGRLLNRMSLSGIRHIPIVDDAGRPVSLVSVRDVMDFLVEAFPRELIEEAV